MTDEAPPEGTSLEGPISDSPPPLAQQEKSYPICGAKRRQAEEVCTRPAGWGTDHAGAGPCKLHGGSNPIKSGRYSSIKRERLRELIEELEKDPNPLDMTPELIACRALFVDYVERYDEFTKELPSQPGRLSWVIPPARTVMGCGHESRAYRARQSGV